MNIIEAIKSGKRFKRPDIDWVEPHEAQDILRNVKYSTIMADDWETEGETK